MCGIAGFVSSNPEYRGKEIVSKMLGRLRHRGPDDVGVRTFGNVTLGMVRLAIIDTEKHDIPITDSTDSLAIVYNGEIYNEIELKNELKSKYSFRTNSDAETILYSYCERGMISWDDFNGMYAFALWDGRQQELFVVRDKAGEKPIYYCQSSDFFAFASEMKALLEVVKPEINYDALSYQAYEFTIGKETLFKNIFALEPGEFVWNKGDTFTVKPYWKVWDHLIQIPNDYQKIKEQLTFLLIDSIKLRTRNCVHKFGVFLGGGVDSALISCISKPDFLYTCHYPLGEDFDELRYAKMVAEKIDRELFVIEPTPEDFIRTRKDVAFFLDTPCTWTAFSLWMIHEKACKNLKVVLTGEGADEMFSGYHRYHLLHHDQQIRNMQAMRQYAYLIEKYYGSPVDRYIKLTNRSDDPNDPNILEFLRESLGYYFSKFSEDVVHSMGLADFYTTMQILLQMSDRIAMAFSIENRSPYLDHRLIQFAFSLPSEFKIKDGITKWILKDIAKDIIPVEIAERIDKRGFSAPLNRWFGWEKYGKYDRRVYRNIAFQDWKEVFFPCG